jgi:hypothetical protein
LFQLGESSCGRLVAKGAVSGHRVTGNRRARARRTRIGNDGRLLGTAGWEFVHVDVVADERGQTAAGFLRRAVRWFASMGVTVERVMSDNGSCYRSQIHAAI